VKTTRYFDLRMQHPTRQDITVEMCERVVRKPVAEMRQGNGERRLHGFIVETGRYLRVIVTEDGEALVNAFWDRGFKGDGDEIPIRSRAGRADRFFCGPQSG